jgi:glycine oxidase
MSDVIVIGGGVVGLSIARELAGRKSVLLVDRGPTGQGTSRAAAGMLAPLSEAGDQGPMFQLSRSSYSLYDDFIAQLHSETGIDVGYSKEGLLFLASSDDAADALHWRYEWQKEAGFEIELVSADAVRRMEPRITAPINAAVFIPGERCVTPRRLVHALHEACFRRGVEIRTNLHVDTVAQNQIRAGAMVLEAENIVIASGVWSGGLAGLNPPIPVHPRKGQILSLDMPSGAFRRMIRWGSSYFVPRPSGELVVGATNEDAGFDMANTPAGLGRLLIDAQQISSHAGSYPILEMWAGLRPATPDNLPIIGRSAIPSVFYATGHYRNGVLLAPITAAVVADLIEGRRPQFPIEMYSPSRFGNSGSDV